MAMVLDPETQSPKSLQSKKKKRKRNVSSRFLMPFHSPLKKEKTTVRTLKEIDFLTATAMAIS